MKILLFNRNEQYIATLKDVLSAKHTEELNGENVLEIETLDEIEKNQRLMYKDKYGYWHEFIVRGVEEERAEAGIIRRVFAEHSFYETWGDYIEDKRPYNVPANTALSVALEPTRWEVGQVDDLGINSTNFYHISAKEAVQKVAETWQGELRYRIEVSGNRITGRYVDLLARRGYDLGKRFTYTKDLISITKTVHRDDVITALYGYGKGQEIVDEEGQPTGGYGRRITFGEINGGKNYVENNDARLVWGRLNPDGTRSHVFGKVEFDDCEDPEKLLQLTTAKLEELSQPIISYEASVIDLKAFGIEHEGVELGDTVGVIDREFRLELRLKARVVKVTRDLLEPENTMIVLGNFIPSVVDSWNEQEKYINNFRGKQGVWDRARIIESDGTINAQFLKNLVDELNTRMNALGGYVYLSEDGKGLITYDKPIDQNPTMAIQLLGGAFRIANRKLPNGEWNWRTFGDGNGFVADAFIGGLLKGGKVHFDLTNGTLLIGDSTENYNLLFDGSTLKLRSVEVEGYVSEGSVEDTIDEKFSEVEIGGRNLLPYSTIGEYGGGAINATSKFTVDGSKITVNFELDDLVGFKVSDVSRYEGEELTLSLYTDLDSPITYYKFDNDVQRNQLLELNGNRFETKISVPIGAQYLNIGVGRYPHPTTFTTYYVDKVQLEKGNIATDWTPAPEDMPTKDELETAGTTVINGGNITTGTIDASKVNVTNINASNIKTGTLTGRTISGGTINGTTINGGTINGANINTDKDISVGKNVKIPLVNPTSALEFMQILLEGQKGLSFGYQNSAGIYPAFISVADYQYLLYGTDNVENQMVDMTIKANHDISLIGDNKIKLTASRIELSNIATGRSTFAPTANSPTISGTIYYGKTFRLTPQIVVTADTSVPYTNVREVGITSDNEESFKISIYRTDSTSTGINWIAILGY